MTNENLKCRELGALCACPACSREYGADEDYDWCDRCGRFEKHGDSRYCAACLKVVKS